MTSDDVKAIADGVMHGPAADYAVPDNWYELPAYTDLRDAFADAIAAFGLAQRQRGREDAAKWHDAEAAELRKACDAAWVEYTPDLGLHAIKVHEESADAIRSLQPEKEPGI
jgi:hypothetical protein